MGYCRLPAVTDYWSIPDSISPQHPICIARSMTYRKFQFIWRHFSSCSPNIDDIHQDGDSEDEEDPRWYRKAELFVQILNEQSKIAVQHPSSNVSVDEMMSRFSGRSGETFRMDNKPIGEGYKFFSIVCSHTGYIWHMIPYGRLENKEDGIIKTVKELVQTLPDYQNKHYTVTMDIFLHTRD